MKTIRIPTFADVHVHLREPGSTQKEDFETGTNAAIAGGYTQILDMPNNNPPTVSPTALDDKEKLASGRIWCDVGFNFGATASSTLFFNKVRRRVFGLKLYMNKTTGPLLIKNAQERELIFKSWDGQLPIMVHATSETVKVAIDLAKKYKRKIHICHVTADQLPMIIKAQESGIEITTEVCPHHLFLSTDDLDQLGAFGMMQPPLLSKEGSQKLWKHLGQIDMISTDHAPHTVDEKLDQSSPKYGVPGLETTLPLMFFAIERGMVSQKRVIEMLSTNPRKIFNLPEQADTYMEVDLSKKFTIGDKKLYTKCQWTPFKGLVGVGELKRVVLRGHVVFRGGKFIGKPSGKMIRPTT